MKTFLKDKGEVFSELHEEIFAQYSQEDIEKAVARLLVEVKGIKRIPKEAIAESVMSVLNKTETYNVMSTLIELDKMISGKDNSGVIDSELLSSMKDSSYNIHRTIAKSICGMYGSGADSLFGFVDCKFRFFFPEKHPKTFISKGICAIVASAATAVISNNVKDDYTERNLNLLKERGVSLDDMTDIVDSLQRPYTPGLDRKLCEEHILAVLRKQETFHAIQLAYKIDVAVEQGKLSEQYNHIVGSDEGLFGVDESVAIAISLLYGTIALTNFGYLDKQKIGIISQLDSCSHLSKCNTFLDDVTASICSAAAGRLAHNNISTLNKPLN